MDISDTLAPNSDQLDAVDLAATGPQIFTVKSVSAGNAEQPVQVHLVEFPRGPWRPSKNMRRVLAACWGVHSSAWVGRRVELYCDPDVIFGKEKVGGVRIKRLSDINGAQQVPLIVSRGKSAVYTVQPLRKVPDAPASPPAAVEGTHRDDPENVAPERPSGTTPSPEASEAPRETVVAAVNRQILEMQAEGGAAHLRTWADSVGVNASSKAIAEKYGDAARDLRWLMGQTDGA